MIAAHQFSEVYKAMGIDPGKRGCIMLDTERVMVSDIIKISDIYVKEGSDDPLLPTSGFEPHVTLLYGLQYSGPEMSTAVNGMLFGGNVEPWKMPETLRIKEVGFFYGDPTEPSVAIVAEIEVTEQLLEGNQRLKQLMHIDPYPEYKPHLTLAYVQDTADFTGYVSKLQAKLVGTSVMVVGLNYGH